MDPQIVGVAKLPQMEGSHLGFQILILEVTKLQHGLGVSHGCAKSAATWFLGRSPVHRLVSCSICLCPQCLRLVIGREPATAKP